MFAFVTFTFAQLGPNRTYYYEQVSRISKNGERTASSGDGHYLTMNNKYLYESNSQGHTLGYGQMKYSSSTNGFPTYDGNSYLGIGLSYRFAADFSRLNIILYDGTVLVYERKSKANANNMRRYVSEDDGNGGTFVSIPNVYSNTGSYNSSSTETKKRNPNDDYYEYQCAHCNGTGRAEINRSINVGGFGISEVVYVTCHECGKRYDKNGTIHRHEMCSKCHGKGKIRARH